MGWGSQGSSVGVSLVEQERWSTSPLRSWFRRSIVSAGFQSSPSAWKERCTGVFACGGLVQIISVSLSFRFLRPSSDDRNPECLDAGPSEVTEEGWGVEGT